MRRREKEPTVREQARIKAGVSLKDAAKMVAVREPYFRRLELNVHLPMSFDMADRLAREYKCSLWVFTPRRKESAR